MTIVAGYDDGAVVCLGADSLETVGLLCTTGHTKLVQLGPCWASASGLSVWDNFLLTATPPERSVSGPRPWWAWCLALSEQWLGWAKERGQGEATDGVWAVHGRLLVATPGGLYCVDSSGGVQLRPRYFAIGSGADVAMGALWMHGAAGGGAKRAVSNAVKACIAHCIHCGGDVQTRCVEVVDREDVG